MLLANNYCFIYMFYFIVLSSSPTLLLFESFLLSSLTLLESEKLDSSSLALSCYISADTIWGVLWPLT